MLGFYGTFDVFAVGFAGLSTAPLRGLILSFIAAFFLAYALKLPGALTHNGFRYPYLLMPYLMAGWMSHKWKNRLVRPKSSGSIITLGYHQASEELE
jgi:uncharacterized membrane protein